MGKVTELVIKKRCLVDDGYVDTVNISYKGSLAFGPSISAEINDLHCKYAHLVHMVERNEIYIELLENLPVHMNEDMNDFRRYPVAPKNLEFSCYGFLNANGILPLRHGNTYTCRLIQDVNGCYIVVIHRWARIQKGTKTRKAKCSD